MERFFDWKRLTSSKPLLYAFIALVVLGGWWLFSGRDNEERETLVVLRGEFIQEVSVSGKVVAAQDVDLAFPETGRVSSINVSVGQRVGTGQGLASLAAETLFSDLRVAEVDLAETRKEQDAQVQSALRNLLSDDLTAVPVSSTYSATPPTVTGLYDGPEGTYRIRIDQTVNPGTYEIRVLGLESREPIEILEDEPTALGTRGLFVTFSDEIEAYNNTTWTVEVPNTKSTSYRGNFNAYEEAQRTRDRLIANAEADVSRIKTDIGQRTLRAPFSGTVTAVDVELGSIVSANSFVISLISAETLQIESFVPEINLSLVEVGAQAEVTLDAYGDEVPFAATVVSVDPAETIRDGVSTYRAILEFSADDERIRSGMTANVRITADRRTNIISIPQGLVVNRDGNKYVSVLVDGDVEEREIEIGGLSSLGSVEVLSGLEAGEILVITD